MKYINKKLFIEKTKIERLSKKFKTPFYCYSHEALRNNIFNLKRNFRSVNPIFCFSIKSNPNLNLIKEIKKFGFGADVVSIGEMMKALKAGINPKKIVFSGIGKTKEELTFSINKRIFLINIESKSEMQKIENIARSKKRIVDIGIRLNPNIDAKTLKDISTGRSGNKFGVLESEIYNLIDNIKLSRYLRLKCLSVHIGSQIMDHKPFIKMINVISRVVKKSKHNFSFIDLGGGMGIPYSNEKKTLNYKIYSKAVKKFVDKFKCKIIFEPGRSIVGNTAMLVSKIIYLKKSKNKTFVILDAGMNDFLRPALYKASHKIIPVLKNIKNKNVNFEFVGPICETTDTFVSYKDYYKIKEGDLIAICDVGAYGISLASNYNVRPKPCEILVSGSKTKILSRREDIKNLI